MKFVHAPRRSVAVLVGVAVLALSPAQALAEEGTGASAAYGIGSALCSLIYAPTKIVYATLGSVIGGFAWLFSAGDNEVASAVITPAVRGDYVVVPAHLRGEQPLEFIGRKPAPAYAPPPPQPQAY
jgi:hypothetical protein